MIYSPMISRDARLRLLDLGFGGIMSAMRVSYLTSTDIQMLQSLANEVDGPDGDMAVDILRDVLLHEDNRDRFLAALAENPLGDFYSLSK